MKNKFFIDSTIPVIATQQIGEAWALVILQEIARGNLSGWTDTFAFLEILEGYAFQGRRFEGKNLYRAFRRLLGGEAAEVTVEDFENAFGGWSESRAAGPREHLHAAVIARRIAPNVLSVDGPGYENLAGLHRVDMRSLLESLKLQGDYIEER